VLNFFHPEPAVEGKIHTSALIDPSATLAELVDIGPGAVIEAGAKIAADCSIGAGVYVGRDASIGAGTRIAPNAYIHDRTEIGARCVVGPNATIGWSGFKYEKVNGAATYIPQVGRVVLEDDVHLGANSTIDRAGFHETRIGARTKIDNLVQIGHNVQIAPDCILCAQAGVAGSSKLGRGVILAGQAGVADHLTLADGVIMLAQAGAAADLEKAGMYFGSPCEPHREWYRKRALIGQLADMKKRLAALEKAMGAEEK
jgi:UDP-3-O-[3-hydroxymyristoyl] glucosamine N-acyltransferase